MRDSDDDLFGPVPTGEPIGFDDVPETDDPIEDEPEEVAEERATVRYRRAVERRRRRLLFLVLATFTLYVVLLNLYKIHRMSGLEVDLELRLRHALHEVVTYSADMAWISLPEGAEASPALLIDGAPTPRAIRCSPRDSGFEPLRLSLMIPDGTLPGDYVGRLTLAPQGGPPTLQTQEFPLQVHVMSWWEEWSLLIGYLVVLAAILVALHAFNLYWYPAPRGFVTCVHFTDGAWGGGDTITLESRWSWLKSWNRSRVPLGRIIERRPWAMSVAPLPEFELEFERIGVSYGVFVWLDFSSSEGRVEVCSEKPRQGPPTEGRPAPMRVRLSQGKTSKWYQVAVDHDWFAFQVELPLFK